MNLVNYIFRRLLLAIPVLLLVSLLAFSIIHIAPGDPVQMMVNPKMGEEVIEQVRRDLGLDQPFHVQYGLFLQRIATGRMGKSLYTQENISSMILRRLPQTLILMITGLSVAYLCAIPIGVIAAIRKGKPLDYLSMSFALVGVGVPRFWLGLLLILVFSVRLGWFPVAGHGDIRHLVLPVITLAVTSMAYVARVMRSSMLEFLKKDFVTTARSKGLFEKAVIFKHVMRNAIGPIISLFGLDFGWMIGGAVMVEYVFNRPGLGRLMVDSIYMRDYPVFQILLLLLTASVIIGNLTGDILLALVDPRVRHE